MIVAYCIIDPVCVWLFQAELFSNSMPASYEVDVPTLIIILLSGVPPASNEPSTLRKKLLMLTVTSWLNG